MDLSIIIPCHNLEHYIQPLLSSLYNQTFSGIEVEYVFVLDSCTDNTKKVIIEWSKDITNASIKIFETTCRNCGISRNYGLDHTTSKYVWFVDGDDMLLSQHAIEFLYRVISTNKLPLLRFGFFSVWYDVQQDAHLIDHVMIWQYIFERDFIGDLRFENICPDEDREFMKVIYSKVANIPTTDKHFYLYNYDRNGSNMDIYYKEKGKCNK